VREKGGRWFRSSGRAGTVEPALVARCPPWGDYTPEANMAVQIAASHTPMDTSATAIKQVNLLSRRRKAGFLNSRALP
jgi:hypothetical protein